MDFQEFLREQLGHEPTEWQLELFERFSRGERVHVIFPRSIQKRQFERALRGWEELQEDLRGDPESG